MTWVIREDETMGALWRRQEMHRGFRWENLKERDHLEDMGIDR
jgi:hypothetical protein